MQLLNTPRKEGRQPREGFVTQSCPTPCDPLDCSLPGSSVHGILQARLESVVILFSRGSSPPSDQTRASCTTYSPAFLTFYSWLTFAKNFIRVHPSLKESCLIDHADLPKSRQTKSEDLVSPEILLYGFKLH